MPMSNTQLLLVKLAEEADEVSKRALKAAQFGLGEVEPLQQRPNKNRLHDELNDLMAAIEMLNDETGFDYTMSQRQIDAKIKKVCHYRDYSRSLGLVETEQQ